MVEEVLRALELQRDEPEKVVEMSVLARALSSAQLRVDRFANWK